jgi:hypothetical protein
MRSGEALRHDQDEDDEERKAMIWLRAHIVRHRPDFSGYGPDDSLEILGIDSLASVLLVRSVRSCLAPYGKRIGSNDLFGETLRSFARRHLLGLDLTVKEEEYDEVSREDEEEEAKLLSSSSLEIEESAPEDYGIKLHPPPPPPPPPPKTAKLLLSIRGILTLLVLYEHFHGPERVISPLVSSNTSLFVLLSGFSTALSSSSSTSNLLVTRAVGIFPLLWVALLLNAPRWIEEDMIRSHGLSPRGHPIVPDVDISPDFYLKRDSLICDVLYVLALQCWYRPQCRERGPNNVIYASILWSVFILYVGALWVCRHCALPRACSFSSPRLNLGASVVGMVLTALFLHMKNGLSFFCFFMTGVSAAELFKELWEKKHSASSSPRPPTFFLVAADDAIALALVFSFWLPTIPHLSFWLQNCGVHLLVVFFLLVSLLSDADGIAAKALFSALFEPLRLIGFASYPTYLVQRAFCDTWLPMFTHLLHRGEWVWDVHDSRGVETYSLFGKATTLALLLLFSYALQRYVQDGLVASLYARLQ